jgi:hypothetical protein
LFDGMNKPRFVLDTFAYAQLAGCNRPRTLDIFTSDSYFKTVILLVKTLPSKFKR